MAAGNKKDFVSNAIVGAVSGIFALGLSKVLPPALNLTARSIAPAASALGYIKGAGTVAMVVTFGMAAAARAAKTIQEAAIQRKEGTFINKEVDEVQDKAMDNVANAAGKANELLNNPEMQKKVASIVDNIPTSAIVTAGTFGAIASIPLVSYPAVPTLSYLGAEYGADRATNAIFHSKPFSLKYNQDSVRLATVASLAGTFLPSVLNLSGKKMPIFSGVLAGVLSITWPDAFQSLVPQRLINRIQTSASKAVGEISSVQNQV